MKFDYKKTGIKILKITGITIGSILLLLFLIPMLFPGTIAEQVKTLANKKLDGELEFKESNLSFFRHFPSLTVSLDDLVLKGSAPYKKDTLVSAKEIGFGINLKNLIFDGVVNIDEIFVSDGLINVKVNEKGQANYNVYISDEKEVATDSTETAIHLERIDIKNVRLKYNDISAKINIDAKGFNYVGKGNLDQSIFDLYTEAKIASLDFTFDGETYLKNKEVDADLITKINTNSLAFVFQQNDLKINKLPISFIGKMNFLRDGYDVNLKIESNNSRLNDVFTALPPKYVTWLEKTKVKGRTDLLLTFKGNYNASLNKKPDLAFAMNIREGSIAYSDSPFVTSNISLKFKTVLPSLDTENLIVDLDTLHFNIGEDYLSAKINSKGLKNMALFADLKSKLDLSKLSRSVGIDGLDFKGNLTASVKAKGEYNAEKKLFPVTAGVINLQNGEVKTEYYPNPITDIKFIGAIKNETGKFKDVDIQLNPASFVFEGKPVFVKAILSNFEDVNYDVVAKGELDISRIYKVFKQDGLDVTGYAKADLSLKGKQSYATNGQYSKLQNKGSLALIDIRTTSELFPKPFLIKQGLFTFNQDKMNFDQFTANYGKSDFALKGHLQNVINFFLEKNATLKGNFVIDADNILADEFMAETSTATGKPNDKSDVAKENPKSSGVILLPTNLNVSLLANAKNVEYDGLKLKNVLGNVAVRNGKLLFEKINFDIIDCNVGINGFYDDLNPKEATFDIRFVAKNFNVKRAYKEIKMFRELPSAAEKAEGIISLDYTVKGNLNQGMQPIYPSLEGNGVVSLSKIKVNGLKLFGQLSKDTDFESLDNPDLSKVDIKSSIKNNIISIEETKMKIALFRLRLKGETSFDGQLDLRIRVGLPPLGLIGIPVVVTGTSEAPKIKVFSKTGDEIEETKYKKN
ncbi:AsmA-like C-terminal region-containing protein [Flavobacterium macacae]|uniref:Membrane assembly protein AsmA n=1 Tax=Flavobacterium macacae TaxID=2488993 RepID=A0A3P3WF80_9FLAO|nr:AsmA-like C-terminal region-containing protein [Flavobacterium macacae]RRJ93772.1 membrane assembly protein AsmA [Flavobacterium macacae]